MGNTGPGGKARRKNQASKIQVSGNAIIEMPTGGSGGGGDSTFEELTISLVKLNLPTCEQAKTGDSVNVQWLSEEYAVFLNGLILGYIPVVYNSSLRSPNNHRGRITQVRLKPNPSITIQVRVAI